jgi:NAD(P)-dependent dehydrogenase (short-subunit alcohol dehydrogenase family)
MAIALITGASRGIGQATALLRQEVAAQVDRVNGVRPGFIYSGMLASGQPEEVAQAIAWLLSDKAFM